MHTCPRCKGMGYTYEMLTLTRGFHQPCSLCDRTGKLKVAKAPTIPKDFPKYALKWKRRTKKRKRR